jgi:hypothetical protein
VQENSPDSFLPSPKVKNQWIYSFRGELRRMDRKNPAAAQEKVLTKTDGVPISWSTKGIVVYDWKHHLLQLLDEAGKVKGEIQF